MMTKTKAKRASYDAQAHEPLPITPLEYSGLQQAFAFLNAKLFDGQLPNVFLTMQRRAKSGGYFSPDRFTKRGSSEREHELALNPDIFTTKTDAFIVSILLHEMVHLWQHVRGTAPKRHGYHDKEWAAKMTSVGLMPSNNGMVGGRVTGMRMQHYIIDGGPFSQAFAELAASGWKLHLESTPYRGETRAPNSKTKFTCPSCGQNAWAKPNAQLMCLFCFTEFAERLGVTIDPEVDKLVTMVSTESVKTNAAA
jgi:SprT-like family